MAFDFDTFLKKESLQPFYEEMLTLDQATLGSKESFFSAYQDSVNKSLVCLHIAATKFADTNSMFQLAVKLTSSLCYSFNKEQRIFEKKTGAPLPWSTLLLQAEYPITSARLFAGYCLKEKNPGFVAVLGIVEILQNKKLPNISFDNLLALFSFFIDKALSALSQIENNDIKLDPDFYYRTLEIGITLFIEKYPECAMSFLEKLDSIPGNQLTAIQRNRLNDFYKKLFFLPTEDTALQERIARTENKELRDILALSPYAKLKLAFSHLQMNEFRQAFENFWDVTVNQQSTVTQKNISFTAMFCISIEEPGITKPCYQETIKFIERKQLAAAEIEKILLRHHLLFISPTQLKQFVASQFRGPFVKNSAVLSFVLAIAFLRAGLTDKAREYFPKIFPAEFPAWVTFHIEKFNLTPDEINQFIQWQADFATHVNASTGLAWRYYSAEKLTTKRLVCFEDPQKLSACTEDTLTALCLQFPFIAVIVFATTILFKKLSDENLRRIITTYENVNENNTDAIFFLALIYLRGFMHLNIEPHYQDAINILSKLPADSQAHPLSKQYFCDFITSSFATDMPQLLLVVGRISYSGLGVAVDRNTAMRCFNRFAEIQGAEKFNETHMTLGQLFYDLADFLEASKHFDAVSTLSSYRPQAILYLQQIRIKEAITAKQYVRALNYLQEINNQINVNFIKSILHDMKVHHQDMIQSMKLLQDTLTNANKPNQLDVNQLKELASALTFLACHARELKLLGNNQKEREGIYKLLGDLVLLVNHNNSELISVELSKSFYNENNRTTSNLHKFEQEYTQLKTTKVSLETLRPLNLNEDPSLLDKMMSGYQKPHNILSSKSSSASPRFHHQVPENHSPEKTAPQPPSPAHSPKPSPSKSSSPLCSIL